MLLAVPGNRSTELGSPTKRPRSLKSKVKSSLSNLTPIRRTLVFLVILFHAVLVLYLTRAHTLSLSFSKLSSNTYGTFPRKKSCETRHIYVYDLPQTFNTDLLNDSTTNPNDGFGPPARELAGIVPESTLPAWYWTDLSLGEVLFHNRMLTYDCRTLEPESATAFYIPFYAGVALRKYSWGNYTASQRGWHPEMLNKWLQEQKWWKRSKGSDHFIMLGRTIWDFGRPRESAENDWGSSLLSMPTMENVVRLPIERNVWNNFEIAVPYPTGFHPRSDSDIIEWQAFVRSRSRNHLFAVVSDYDEQIEHNFRGILKNTCLKEATVCRHVDCGEEKCTGHGKAMVMEAYLDSDFCLLPSGAGFTGRLVFDCMLAGSIPVFSSTKAAYLQYELFLPIETESYSVFIQHNSVRNGTDVMRVLEGFGRADMERLREKVIEYIPRFVYAKPSQGLKKMRDAFDFAIDGVLSKYKAHMERGRTENRNEI